MVQMRGTAFQERPHPAFIHAHQIGQILESGTHAHNTTRMTNEQTHKPSDAHETQHHIPSMHALMIP